MILEKKYFPSKKCHLCVVERKENLAKNPALGVKEPTTNEPEKD